MKKYMCLLILMGLTANLLSGCGFEPLYNQSSPTTHTGVASQFSQIDIAIIPNREGQILRNNLMDRFYQSGLPTRPTARLMIAQIDETLTELDLTKSSDATRAQIRLKTIMTLTDMSGKPLMSRPVQSLTSFNILGSEFASRVTKESARQSAIKDLARQIELNLSLFYSAP